MVMRKRERGSTLVVVLFVAIFLGGVALVAVTSSSRQSEYNTEMVGLGQSSYACEAVAELLRAELVKDFETSGLIAPAWISDIRNGNRYPPTLQRSFTGFPNVVAWVDRVSGVGEPPWLEVVAATVGNQPSQTSHRTRIVIGNGKIFDLAMLTETADCMFCHLEVYGDIGAVGSFGPSHNASTNRSKVHGSVYVAATMNNASQLTVDDTLYQNYDGVKLPQDEDGDGEADYPTIDPAEARAEATGSVYVSNDNTSGAAAEMYYIPVGEVFDAATHAVSPGQLNAMGPVIEGNLVLKGTLDNPIRLAGHLYVSGDVMIEGVVDGRGAIYAGRNTYVTGNIEYQNPPAVPGPGDDPDALARADVRDPTKDELRLASRGNIVIGNYTYHPGTDIGAGGIDPSLVPMKYRQGHAFLEAQFGLDATTKYFVPANSTTGDPSYEVRKVGTQYFDDLGNLVASSDVLTYSGTTQTQKNSRFDAVFAPGQIEKASDGTVSFNRWMSDEVFRQQVLGFENFSNYVWRYDHSGSMLSDVTYNLPGLETVTANVPNNRAHAQSSWTDDRGYGGGIFITQPWSPARVICETGDKPWPTQITKIDAFLYSNKRIGGKTQIELELNGGMISREIGVLAPGGHAYRERFNRSVVSGNATWWSGYKSSVLAPLYETGNATFDVHYDYRLRNGGLGFDLISSVVGDRVLTTRGGHASPPSAP